MEFQILSWLLTCSHPHMPVRAVLEPRKGHFAVSGRAGGIGLPLCNDTAINPVAAALLMRGRAGAPSAVIGLAVSVDMPLCSVRADRAAVP